MEQHHHHQHHLSSSRLSQLEGITAEEILDESISLTKKEEEDDLCGFINSHHHHNQHSHHHHPHHHHHQQEGSSAIDNIKPSSVLDSHVHMPPYMAAHFAFHSPQHHLPFGFSPFAVAAAAVAASSPPPSSNMYRTSSAPALSSSGNSLAPHADAHWSAAGSHFSIVDSVPRDDTPRVSVIYNNEVQYPVSTRAMVMSNSNASGDFPHHVKDGQPAEPSSEVASQDGDDDDEDDDDDDQATVDNDDAYDGDVVPGDVSHQQPVEEEDDDDDDDKRSISSSSTEDGGPLIEEPEPVPQPQPKPEPEPDYEEGDEDHDDDDDEEDSPDARFPNQQSDIQRVERTMPFTFVRLLSETGPDSRIRVWKSNTRLTYYDCTCGSRKPSRCLKKMKVHAGNHDLKYRQCMFCDKKFKSYRSLNAHKRAHKEALSQGSKRRLDSDDD
eukprot:TRINITY_DN3822_c0_g1_i1.p1 TRINITY_DN3822_c0_g1~~TRINITY_DN3822_c0_g1_i1.p1  ORF type:complete len:471 (-),score=93.29 TRINITY_DN3822_c0_g1_i1:1855-3171(-)